MSKPVHVSVDSEIGTLRAVIVHRPGIEVENMDPENAEKALYSDILNLTVARREYDELTAVLSSTAQTFEIQDLLEDILSFETEKAGILRYILGDGYDRDIERLTELSPKLLAASLIEGILLERNTLTNFLSEETYRVRPLHNFLFVRDAAMVIGNAVFVGNMASRVRRREARIMAAVFSHHPGLLADAIIDSAAKPDLEGITLEGGDVLVARDDLLIIGAGARTTPRGIDFIAANWPRTEKRTRHILVQELPKSPESFIHLDMVFTLLGPHHAMVFEPVILKSPKLRPIHITVEDGRILAIEEENNLIDSLGALDMAVTPVFCGGALELNQKREQWHSGANFFAVGPNRVIGYGRNNRTLDAMSQVGFDVLNAKDVISGAAAIDDYEKCVVTITGAELARGGGGCRCLTLPICRQPIRKTEEA